jgi:putative ABC transport system permease protein
MIVNEEVVKKLGFSNPEDVIGKRYQVGINEITGEVVGVVKNFHITSMHSEIVPFVFLNGRDFIRDLSVKLSSADISGTISKIKNKWEQFSIDYPFTYSFLDEQINNFYKREDRQQTIVITFSIMAVLIACLGLLGLASFSIEQRTKEIGIRKVFGASMKEITFMLSKEFLQLVIISGIIASPIVYYLLSGWLEDFAYKADITFDIFIYSILISIFIAFSTISYHAVKASLTNPIKSLKYE